MTTDDSNNSPMRETADPIQELQTAVHEARSLIGCVKITLQAGMGGEETDLEAACDGVMRVLDKVVLDLDPKDFRRAVLACAPKAVNHG